MKINKRINLKNLDKDKDVVNRLVEENITWKLDNYIKKFNNKKDLKINFSLSLEKNKKELFNWIMNVVIDGESFRYKREDYKKLDDLINNLFEHLKESLSNK